MTLLLYAQPYDISAKGFYFRNAEEYDKKATDCRNSYGDPVEEYELQFIDGELIDAEFAKAWEINQANFRPFIKAACEWEDWQKTHFIIAVGECGYEFDPESADPDNFDVDLYEEESMKDLAHRFVDDGLLGDVPEPFQNYIDYDAIARDLSYDYSQTVIGGLSLIYRCG